MATRGVKFEVVYVAGVAIGVGMPTPCAGGTMNEMICNTLFDGKGKLSLKEERKAIASSEKWARRIAELLNASES